MDAAKSAINKFTANRGHRTDVDEVVNPAITQEVVKPHRHEELTQAVDREVHQDHYHTTVQPITHREVIPEKHVHNMMPVENREFQHGNHQETQQRVQAELGQFRDTTVTHQTHHTQAAAATVTGEHVHHHVHETVQPIIQKETIRPEVVHTTVPIHEVHHGAAQHHGMSALPMKTLDEFTRAGGIVTGSKSHHSHEEYEGAPRPYNESLNTNFNKLGLAGAGAGAGATGAGIGSHHGHGHRRSNSFSSSDEEGRRSGVRRHKNRGTGTGLTGGTGIGNSSGNGLSGNTAGTTGATGIRQDQQTGTTKKPSILDRLNPKKDTDGDGKAGLMD